MSKSIRPAQPVSPYLAWGNLGLQTLEMLAASASVIQHRTSRPHSPAQIFSMGGEKLEAAVESSHAMARHWLALRDRGALALWTQWPALLDSAMAPYRTRALGNARRIPRL